MRVPIRSLSLVTATALLVAGGITLAQGDGSGDFEVTGVQVDVTAKSADAARNAGWRIAQRKGWAMLAQRLGGGGASALSDGALDSMVSGIVIEREQIGPTRYIAKLGVLFNRARAGAVLGVDGIGARSAPMLVLPVMWSGGVGTVFEQKTPWADAWARFRTGNSTVDYIRPAGTGIDPLLLNAGQPSRRSRGWWRAILDQYGASDMLVPVVSISRQFPGGPVIGTFEARHGPDETLIARFALKVSSEDGLPALLDAGVKRIDEAYQTAIRGGTLRTDSGLTYTPPLAEVAPVDDSAVAPDEGTVITNPGAPVVAPIAMTIQFDTPNAGALNAAEAAVRGVPGVLGASTTSLALGGTSVMRLSFAGAADTLKAALEARGYVVFGSGTALRIRRAPTLSIPAVPTDTATTQ